MTAALRTSRAERPRLVIHWFRRDLRLADNTALLAASREADVVLPVFVLDPHLLTGPDIGAPRVSFLLECLRELARDVERRGSQLVLRRGRPEEELVALAREVGASAIYTNRDTSPYARVRDARVEAAAARAGIGWRAFDDLLLVPPELCIKDDGSPYTVFTPFARRWRGFEKLPPAPAPRFARTPPEVIERAGGLEIPANEGAYGLRLSAKLPDAGERAAHRRLRELVTQKLERYASERDFPARGATSGLSPHLKFGTISARIVYAEVANAMGDDLARLEPARPARALPAAAARLLLEAGTFLNELCWREFYHTVLFHHPHVLRRPFQERYVRLRWPEPDPALVEAWIEGRTGFPIVDAAMRQLAETAWMHNRLRMIVAMFLTKTLLVDYRVGERVFMQRLVDGDAAANNGGWQWSASTGTDAVPYFRIFNPLSQSRRYDSDGTFIHRFVPELRGLAAPLVHAPDEEPLRRAAAGYPAPCVDYAAARARALALFGRS